MKKTFFFFNFNIPLGNWSAGVDITHSSAIPVVFYNSHLTDINLSEKDGRIWYKPALNISQKTYPRG